MMKWKKTIFLFLVFSQFFFNYSEHNRAFARPWLGDQ